MTARTWLAVVLCCLVWFIYMRWFAPVPPAVHATHQAATSSPQKDETGSSSEPSPSANEVSEKNGLVPGHLATSDAFGTQTAKFVVTFSDVGGKINSIQLKEYTDSIKNSSPGIFTLRPALGSQTLGAFFSDPHLASFGDANFQRQVAGASVDFFRAANGVELKKTYQLSADSYYIQSNFHLAFPDDSRTDWGYFLIPVGAGAVQFNSKSPLSSWEAVAYQNESVTRKNWEKIPSPSQVLQGNTGWVAFGNRYFSTALINRSEINPDVLFSKEPGFSGVYLRYPIVLKPGQKGIDYAVEIYSGPKDSSALAKVPGLKRLIDYGTFSFLAYPMLDLLRFFYRFVHNYGVAIILLTLLVRIVFYPLSVKSYRSMKAMQKLQPQITALKEKYKDDAQRFGQEQMALFKAHKVNPAGGCIPMLVQLPFFIALYAVLGNSIELFHAPFFGWIQDLSDKDPYYVFPVLMGISMLMQQKLTPTAGMDPTQQKIMYLMPIVFTFIMLNLPSGLTIYIFLSTILGVAQQYMMNRERGPASPGLVASPQGGGSK